MSRIGWAAAQLYVGRNFSLSCLPYFLCLCKESKQRKITLNAAEAFWVYQSFSMSKEDILIASSQPLLNYSLSSAVSLPCGKVAMSFLVVLFSPFYG